MKKRNDSQKISMGHTVILRSGAGKHNNRTADVRRGSSRKTKHKGAYHGF